MTTEVSLLYNISKINQFCEILQQGRDLLPFYRICKYILVYKNSQKAFVILIHLQEK